MPELGSLLLQLARGAIAERLGEVSATVDRKTPELQQPAATFVTLTKNGQLRGCIGSLQAHRPLLLDITENAVNAAFRDPRFKPLTLAEWPQIRIEVSLLTLSEAMTFSDEADALAQLRPLVDGVIFSAGNRRSTFLPQVWEQLPKPVDFMAHLKQKAGLPTDYWGPEVQLSRYTVKKWKEALP